MRTLERVLHRRKQPEPQGEWPLHHIKRDSVDIVGKMVDSGIYGFSTIAGMLANSPDASLPTMLAFSAGALGFAAKVGVEVKLEKKWAMRDTIANTYLGYTSQQLVYRGKEPIQLGDTQVRKGDNFLAVTLPQIEGIGSQPTPNQFQLRSAVYDVALRQASRSGRYSDYQMVVIHVPESARKNLTANLADRQTVTNDQVLSGKSLKPEKPEDKVFVLTREEFESLTVTPAKVFNQAEQALKDPEVSAWLTRAYTEQDKTKRKRLEQLLKRRLKAIIVHDINKHLKDNGTTYFTLRPRTDGRLFVQFSSEGDIYQRKLEEVLQMNGGMSVDAIIRRQAPHSNGQLAYSMLEMMREKSFDELTRKREPSANEVVRDLEEAGLSIRESALLYDSGKRLRFNRKLFGKGLVAVAIPTVIAMGTDPLLSATDNLGLDHLKPHRPVPTAPEVPGGSSTPAETPLWKIESLNGQAEGYYTESTSHQLGEDGSWVHNKERAREVSYPRTFQAENQLMLHRNIAIQQFGETSFKVPIRSNTRLAALEITDQNGEPVDYRAFELTDGTVEVVVQDTLIGLPVVNVRAQLKDVTGSEFEKSQVHATEAVTPVINESKLSEEARGMLTRVRTEEAETGFPFHLGIVEAIEEDHQYSLQAPGKEKLATARTAEEKVNVITELSGISCDESNQASVLFMTADRDPEKTVNLATGYLVNIYNNNDSSTSSSYITRPYHAYGIDQEGEVLDATPSNPASDSQTQAYINDRNIRLNNPHIVDLEWQQIVTSETTKGVLAESEADRLRSLGMILGVGLAAGGYFAAIEAALFARRFTKKKDFHAMAEDMVLKVYDVDELKRAFEFFSWLSWAGPNGEEPKAPQTEDKRKLLRLLQTHMDHEIVDRYVNLPPSFQKGYENAAGLSSLKLRFLARHLLN